MSTTKQLSIRNMDAETWKKIRIEALQKSVSIAKVIEIAFNHWMQDQRKNSSKLEGYIK